jgi:spore coat polysaccharide biosynthesis predicted glycosyltransferase SpsG
LTRRALLVADAGPSAGLGHIGRSSAIAVALTIRGIETVCFARGVEAPVECDGIHWESLDPDEPSGRGWDVVVLDSYRLRPEDLELDAQSPPLVVLQEATAPPARAALVVNPSADRADAGPTRLYGLEYACLRPRFWGLPRSRPRRDVEHIVVATGGGDFDGMGAALAEAARMAVDDARVTYVRGPYSADGNVAGVEVAVSPESLHDLLLAADLVVCAGGQTMLEAAAVGAPCVAVPLVENQVEQVCRLAETGAVRPATREGVAAAVAELARTFATRQALAERGQREVDGFGALRVAYAIGALGSRAA